MAVDAKKQALATIVEWLDETHNANITFAPLFEPERLKPLGFDNTEEGLARFIARTLSGAVTSGTARYGEGWFEFPLQNHTVRMVAYIGTRIGHPPAIVWLISLS